MQKRSFLLLLAVTIIAVAAAGWTLAGAHREARPALLGRHVFPKLAAEFSDLTWMRIRHGKAATDLNQIDGHWAVVERGNYPAAANRVRRLLLALADLTLVEPKTARPDRYARLGLDDPSHGQSTEVAVQDRSGRTVADLRIGNNRPDWLGAGDDGVYIKLPHDKRTWLARGALDVPNDIAGWLAPKVLDIPSAQIERVALTASDGKVLVLKRDKPGGNFTVADPLPAALKGDKFKDQETLAQPAGALAGLDLMDVSPRADLPVPESGVSRAVFATADGLTVTLELFTHDKRDWIAVAAKGEGGAAAEARALNARLAPWTFAITTDRAMLLRTRLADLLAPPKGS